jgi:hypothetical protein
MFKILKAYVYLGSRLPSTTLLLLTMFYGAASAQSTAPSGSFGFLINAAVSNSSPNATGLAILGVMTFDGAGNVAGTYLYEVDANSPTAPKTTRGNFTGNYSVNADGTGSMTLALDSGINLTVALATGENGQSLRLVATDYQFPAATCGCNIARVSLSGIARATPAGSLNGSYAALLNNSPNVNASVAVAKFDGAGNVALSLTFVPSSDPQGQPSTPFSGTQTGTYTVNPDGTGAMNFPAVPGVSNAQTFGFVTTDNGSGAFIVQLDRPGSGVMTGTARLQ